MTTRLEAQIAMVKKSDQVDIYENLIAQIEPMMEKIVAADSCNSTLGGIVMGFCMQPGKMTRLGFTIDETEAEKLYNNRKNLSKLFTSKLGDYSL